MPDLPGHLADPLPGVLGSGPPAGRTIGSPGQPRWPATEPTRRRCFARCGSRPAPPTCPDRRVPDRQPRPSTDSWIGRARSSPPSWGSTNRLVAHVVGVIRRCGPPGVGATSISECLLFQLDALGLDDDAGRGSPGRSSRDHLPALARGHFALIATALGVSRTEIQQVLDLIRQRLRPYPAFDGNAPEVSCYVVPDVVVREHDEVAR